MYSLLALSDSELHMRLLFRCNLEFDAWPGNDLGPNLVN